MTRLGLLFGVLVACGPQAQEEHYLCAEHRCDLVPLAFEATDPVVEQVVADLRKATGADVITDPFGVPVIFEPEVINPETGDATCGHTLTAWMGAEILYQEIHVATDAEGCGTPWHTVAHEMIHALVPRAEHNETGVFAQKANDMQHFDRAAIDVICSALSCGS